MKVLTVGGATQDTFLHFDGGNSMQLVQNMDQHSYLLLESGEKIEIQNLSIFTGGGATNSAASFKLLGFDVAAYLPVADDEAGKLVLADLTARGIDTSQVAHTTTHPTGVSFIVKAHELDRTILVHRGANGHMDSASIPLEAIAAADQLYLTSLGGTSSALLKPIVAHAKQHNVPVAVNPGSGQLSDGVQALKECLSSIDTLIMNGAEAKQFMIALVESDDVYKRTLMSGYKGKYCPIDTDMAEPCLLQYPTPHEDMRFSTRKFFQEVLKLGPSTVVITNGANGVYAARQDAIYFHQAVDTTIVDTVGAGDAFGSTFVASLARGDELTAAMRFGILNSTSVIGKLGAKDGLSTFEQLERASKETATPACERFEF